MLDAKNILQVNATIITGLLILLTISSFDRPYQTDEKLSQIKSEIDAFVRDYPQLEKAGPDVVLSERQALQDKLNDTLSKRYTEFTTTAAGVVFQLIPFFSASAIGAAISAVVEKDHPRLADWFLRWVSTAGLIFSFGLLLILVSGYAMGTSIPDTFR